MFLKRLSLLFFLYLSTSGFSGGIPVFVRYVTQGSADQSEPFYLAEFISIGPKDQLVTFERTDSLYRNWKITGNGFDGSANLFVSKERGIGWQIGLDGDSLKVLIARDYKNTNDPRIISITTSFVAGLFILENFEPDCNSYFKVYSLKNSWDADVEYTGNYGLEIESSNPCADGSWKTKTGKLKVPKKVLYVTIFTAVMTQNLRYLFKDFTL